MRLLPLDPVYSNEHQGKKVGLIYYETRYLSKSERARFQVIYRNHHFYDQTGALLHTDQLEKGIFIISKSGEMYFAPRKVVGKLHHSSFVGGDEVFYAGHIDFQNGQISFISDRSGHYKSDYIQNVLFFQFLKKHQIKLDPKILISMNLGQVDMNGDLLVTYAYLHKFVEALTSSELNVEQIQKIQEALKANQFRDFKEFKKILEAFSS